MAVSDYSGLTTTQPQTGIQFTKVTDSSADWSSVSVSTYFYDKTDKLVHYKDSTGTIQEMYGVTLTATSLKTLIDTFASASVVDADVVPITDSVGTTTKKLSWSGIKSTLLAYFDTVYPRKTVATTGSVISFVVPVIWNTPASPSTDDLTDDLSGAKIGYIQKIYHNKAVAPTVPVGWVLIGTGTYTTSTLNIIFAEWVSGTRVEYWITKPA